MEPGVDIDNEVLIAEVRRRPALYDARLKDYGDRALKESLWDAVCARLFPRWDHLPDAERCLQGKLVQRRWKSLRDSFRRELNSQLGKGSTAMAKRRRRYIYFNHLQFLMQSLLDERQGDAAGASPVPETNDMEESEGPDEELLAAMTTKVAKVPKVPKTKRTAKPCGSYEEELLTILRKKCNQELDEDESFLMSLVPSFKRLDEDNKFEAKIRILNVMRDLTRKCRVVQGGQKRLYEAVSGEENDDQNVGDEEEASDDEDSVALPDAEKQEDNNQCDVLLQEDVTIKTECSIDEYDML